MGVEVSFLDNFFFFCQKVSGSRICRFFKLFIKLRLTRIPFLYMNT